MQNDKSEITKKIKSYFSKQKEILAVYLYGSQVTGRLSPRSDIDIGVLLRNHKKIKRGFSFDSKMKYTLDLMDVFRTDNVDVVILNDADLFLVQQVFTKGEEVWTSDRKKSEELKWYLLNLSWDYSLSVKRIFDEEALKWMRQMAYGH